MQRASDGSGGDSALIAGTAVMAPPEKKNQILRETVSFKFKKTGTVRFRW